MKGLITTIVIILIGVGVYFGVTNYEANKAKADEQIFYTVHVMKNSEYGYIPKHDFDISKSSLKAMVELCYWEARWLNNGDLLIGIDADRDETWFVQFKGNDKMIREIRGMDTACVIPEK